MESKAEKSQAERKADEANENRKRLRLKGRKPPTAAKCNRTGISQGKDEETCSKNKLLDQEDFDS